VSPEEHAQLVRVLVPVSREVGPCDERLPQAGLLSLPVSAPVPPDGVAGIGEEPAPSPWVPFMLMAQRRRPPGNDGRKARNKRIGSAVSVADKWKRPVRSDH